MQNFENTNKKLDTLINKLEANVGGETTTASKSTKPTQPVKAQQKQQEQKQKQQEPKAAPKKEEPKKKEDEQAKKEGQQAKKDQDAKVEEGGEKPQKQKKEKKDKKPKEPKAKEEVKEPAELGPKDFALIDMRIGEIVECWKHPESENLFCEKISVCGEVRDIASGLQKYVPLDQMKGIVVVMVNLKVRPLAGFPSNGMVMCESNADHTEIRVLRPEGANGERIMLEGFEELFDGGDILPVLNPKKKVLDKCLEHFKTDEQGFVVWKGIRCITKVGPLKGTFSKGSVS